MFFDAHTRRLPCVEIYISFASHHLEEPIPSSSPLPPKLESGGTPPTQFYSQEIAHAFHG